MELVVFCERIPIPLVTAVSTRTLPVVPTYLTTTFDTHDPCSLCVPVDAEAGPRNTNTSGEANHATLHADKIHTSYDHPILWERVLVTRRVMHPHLITACTMIVSNRPPPMLTTRTDILCLSSCYRLDPHPAVRFLAVTSLKNVSHHKHQFLGRSTLSLNTRWFCSPRYPCQICHQPDSRKQPTDQKQSLTDVI